MPIPPDFEAECLYARDAWFIHDVVEMSPETDRVVALVDTTRLGLLVDAQRTWPGHPQHFPGAVAMQITGTLGQLHAIYLMGLRASEGWVGFGTHIEQAKFPSMGEIGPPVLARLDVTRKRHLRGTWFLSYAFEYSQNDQVVYQSRQTAAWFRTDHRGPLA